MDIRQVNDLYNSKPKEIYKENKSLGEKPQQNKKIDTYIEKILDNYGRAYVSFGAQTQQNSSARKEEMKKLFFTLKNLKDENGNLRFNTPEIALFLPLITPDNKNFFYQLMEMKDDKGNYRFNERDLHFCLKYLHSENIDFIKELADKKDDDGNYRFDGKDISYITSAITEKNELLQMLINDNSKDEYGNYRLTGFDISCMLKTATPENEDKIITLAFKKDEDGNFIFNSQSIISLLPYIDNIDKYIDLVEHQKTKVMEHPNLYVNGQFDNKDDEITEINMFFKRNYASLIKLFDIFDKETINNLLRRRFDDAQEYIDDFSTTTTEDKKLFKSLCSSESMEGVPFSSEQKIDFLYIIKSYSNTKTDKSKIYEMLDSGKINIDKLKSDLLKGIFKHCGMTEEEIAQTTPEKFNSWDIDFIHLLTTSFGEEYFPLNDLIKSANLYDFNQYIQDESNEYGEVNSRTKTQYESHNMNYQAWLKPSQSNNVNFISNDRNKEQLLQIKDKLKEDIEMLRQGPAKSFVDKQFSKYIINDKLVFPDECTSSRIKLEELIQNTLKQLESVFKRAENNLNNPQKVNSAQNTLTVKNHLLQLLKDIESMSNSKALKTYDLTIKMWDRFPQKDLFQGNYSTCCIGIGGGNHEAMPHYLLNTAYNMIEFVDNKTGKTIGNALCYFITDANNKPAFIIDNIEIKNSKIPSKEVGIKLRTAITEYASKVAKEVTGKDDTPIYMSSSYNDVACDDLKSSYQIINFLGDIDCDDIYMDLYNGWVDKSDFKSNVKLLKLK